MGTNPRIIYRDGSHGAISHDTTTERKPAVAMPNKEDRQFLSRSKHAVRKTFQARLHARIRVGVTSLTV